MLSGSFLKATIYSSATSLPIADLTLESGAFSLTCGQERLLNRLALVPGLSVVAPWGRLHFVDPCSTSQQSDLILLQLSTPAAEGDILLIYPSEGRIASAFGRLALQIGVPSLFSRIAGTVYEGQGYDLLSIETALH